MCATTRRRQLSISMQSAGAGTQPKPAVCIGIPECRRRYPRQSRSRNRPRTRKDAVQFPITMWMPEKRNRSITPNRPCLPTAPTSPASGCWPPGRCLSLYRTLLVEPRSWPATRCATHDAEPEGLSSPSSRSAASTRSGMLTGCGTRRPSRSVSSSRSSRAVKMSLRPGRFL